MAAAHFTSSSRGDGDTIDACRHENSCATSGWAGIIVRRRSACTARGRRGQPPPRCCPPRCCSAHPGRRHCPSRRRRRRHRISRYRRSVAAMGRPPGLLHARQLRSANAERARDGASGGAHLSARCSPARPPQCARCWRATARRASPATPGPARATSAAPIWGYKAAPGIRLLCVNRRMCQRRAARASYLWRLAHRSKVAPSCSEPAGLAGMVRAAGLGGDAGAPP